MLLRYIFSFSLAIYFLALPGSAQDAPDNEAVPAKAIAQSKPLVFSENMLAAPLLPERNLGQAPGNIAPALVSGGDRPKPPLAWRARAYKLSCLPLQTDINKPCWYSTFSASYYDVLPALLAVCDELNYSVKGLFEPAGQILVETNGDSSPRIVIFAVSEMPPGKTIVRVASDKQLPLTNPVYLKQFFSLVQSRLDKKGSI